MKQGEQQKFSIAEYNVKDAVLSELKSKYNGMKIVDAASYKTVTEGIRECRNLRIGVEDTRLKSGREILALKKQQDLEGKRIIGVITSIEKPLKAEKKKEDDRKADIKAEKDRLEKERTDNIRNAIDKIRRFSIDAGFLTTEELQSRFDTLKAININKETHMEFTAEAETARLETIQLVKHAIEERLRLDKEESERKAEAKRLEIIRAEQEAERKKIEDEKERIAVAQRKIDEENARIEAEKKAEQERKEREEFERKAKEEARIQAEKDAKDKAEREERERVEREKKEKAEVERQESLKPDKEKLLEFADKLDHRIDRPMLNSSEADQVLSDALKGISYIAEEIRRGVKHL